MIDPVHVGLIEVNGEVLGELRDGMAEGMVLLVKSNMGMFRTAD